MAANYTAHLTSVLVVLVVAFAAFVTACAFLLCGSFTNKTRANALVLCVFRSFVRQYIKVRHVYASMLFCYVCGYIIATLQTFTACV